MAEILVKAADQTDVDPVKDRRRYKRGMCVVVKEDGHSWGGKEGLPKFVVIKIPGVPASRVMKYIAERNEYDPTTGEMEMFQRRLWRIRWEDLPQVAKNKLKNSGELTIKAGNYSGLYDYTWQQVKNYFWDQKNNAGENEDI